jgi:ribosome-associated protein
MIATRPKTKRKTPASKKTRTRPGSLTKVAVAALEDMKAVNVKVLDVRKLTDVTDTMIVATGNSDRHVKSIADRVIERCREAGHRAYGVEGQKQGEWVLVDLQDLIVHVMLPRIREFYGLEKLWDLRPAQREPSVA